MCIIKSHNGRISNVHRQPSVTRVTVPNSHATYNNQSIDNNKFECRTLSIPLDCISADVQLTDPRLRTRSS